MTSARRRAAVRGGPAAPAWPTVATPSEAAWPAAAGASTRAAGCLGHLAPGHGRARAEAATRGSTQIDEWVRVDPVRDEATSAVARGRRADAGASATGVTSWPRRSAASWPLGRLDPGAPARAAPGRCLPGVRRPSATPTRPAILRSSPRRPPGWRRPASSTGLTLYRQGKWRPAIKQLEAFRLLTGSTEQHPVLADCYRALGQDDQRRRAVGRAAPGVAQRRAGGRGPDRGGRDAGRPGRPRPAPSGCSRTAGGCPSRPHDHHLRRGYALADLYERAGDLARARAARSSWVRAGGSRLRRRPPSAAAPWADRRRAAPVIPASPTRLRWRQTGPPVPDRRAVRPRHQLRSGMTDIQGLLGDDADSLLTHVSKGIPART